MSKPIFKIYPAKNPELFAKCGVYRINRTERDEDGYMTFSVIRTGEPVREFETRFLERFLQWFEQKYFEIRLEDDDEHRGGPLSADKLAHIIELHEEGYTRRHIAQIIGCHHTSIGNKLREAA